MVSKLYLVNLEKNMMPSAENCSSIQEAIDKSEPGDTILLGPGDYYGSIILKDYLKFQGVNGSKLYCEINGEYDNIIFEKIIFINYDNKSLKFKGNFLFINCEFHITMTGLEISLSENYINYGFYLNGGSAFLQNCFFYMNIKYLKKFIAIGAEKSNFITLQSPIIRLYYNNVDKIETYFFKTSKKNSYFEAFSSSIHFKTKFRKLDCKLNKKKTSFLRLFKGLNLLDKKCLTNISLNNTKIFLIKGNGSFNIASADNFVYINGLTLSASNGKNWIAGDFHNIFLTSFMSNILAANEIKDFNCIKDTESSYSSTSFSMSSGCSKNCKKCLDK